jgi:hypothetical protein
MVRIEPYKLAHLVVGQLDKQEWMVHLDIR